MAHGTYLTMNARWRHLFARTPTLVSTCSTARHTTLAMSDANYHPQFCVSHRTEQCAGTAWKPTMIRPCPAAVCSREATQRGFPYWPWRWLKHESAKGELQGEDRRTPTASTDLGSCAHSVAVPCRAAGWLWEPRASAAMSVRGFSRVVLRGLS